jgi:hypothetical protein
VKVRFHLVHRRADLHDQLKQAAFGQDPAGREEQFERLYLLLLDANPFTPRIERNFDLYEAADGGIHKI